MNMSLVTSGCDLDVIVKKFGSPVVSYPLSSGVVGSMLLE